VSAPDQVTDLYRELALHRAQEAIDKLRLAPTDRLLAQTAELLEESAGALACMTALYATPRLRRRAPPRDRQEPPAADQIRGVTYTSPPVTDSRPRQPKRSPDNRPAPRSPTTTGRPPRARGLRCRIRLADGRTFSGELPAHRHRSLQLGMLHADTNGLVELAAGRREDGKLRITTRPRPPRTRPDHFLPGGASGMQSWLEGMLALADRHAQRGEEVFFAPAVRSVPRADKHAVSHTRALWIDVDRPDQLAQLWAFLAERPCRLLVSGGGSGGVHAYWRLHDRLEATSVVEDTGELIEPIERALLRIIHRLGVDASGRPNVADTQCAERSRVMRLAGTINNKTGGHARILEADFSLPRYDIRQLVGDLPDPTPARPAPMPRPTTGFKGDNEDPYNAIPPPVYFGQLAGIDVPAGGGLVCCLAHPDRNPSARSAPHPSRAGAATRTDAARAARSTTSRPCCSAGRGAPASCAAKRSAPPTPTSPTCSARSPEHSNPETHKKGARCSRSPPPPPSRSRCVPSAWRTRAAAQPPP
jgi:hypothetical protein